MTRAWVPAWKFFFSLCPIRQVSIANIHVIKIFTILWKIHNYKKLYLYSFLLLFIFKFTLFLFIEYAHSEPSDDNKRIHHETSLSNSHHLAKDYNPADGDINRNACRNLSCEQLCLRGKSGYHCKCCPGFILNTDKKTCRCKYEILSFERI